MKFRKTFTKSITAAKIVEIPGWPIPMMMVDRIIKPEKKDNAKIRMLKDGPAPAKLAEYTVSIRLSAVPLTMNAIGNDIIKVYLNDWLIYFFVKSISFIEKDLAIEGNKLVERAANTKYGTLANVLADVYNPTRTFSDNKPLTNSKSTSKRRKTATE